MKNNIFVFFVITLFTLVGCGNKNPSKKNSGILLFENENCYFGECSDKILNQYFSIEDEKFIVNTSTSYEVTNIISNGSEIISKEKVLVVDKFYSSEYLSDNSNEIMVYFSDAKIINKTFINSNNHKTMFDGRKQLAYEKFFINFKPYIKGYTNNIWEKIDEIYFSETQIIDEEIINKIFSSFADLVINPVLEFAISFNHLSKEISIEINLSKLFQIYSSSSDYMMSFNFSSLNDETILLEDFIMPELEMEEYGYSRSIYYITYDLNYDAPYQPSKIGKSPGADISSQVSSLNNRLGYKFLGWYVDGILFTSKIMPARDITLVAHWEEIVLVEDPVMHFNIAKSKLAAKLRNIYYTYDDYYGLNEYAYITKSNGDMDYIYAMSTDYLTSQIIYLSEDNYYYRLYNTPKTKSTSNEGLSSYLVVIEAIESFLKNASITNIQIKSKESKSIWNIEANYQMGNNQGSIYFTMNGYSHEITNFIVERNDGARYYPDYLRQNGQMIPIVHYSLNYKNGLVSIKGKDIESSLFKQLRFDNIEKIIISTYDKYECQII